MINKCGNPDGIEEVEMNAHRITLTLVNGNKVTIATNNKRLHITVRSYKGALKKLHPIALEHDTIVNVDYD